MAKDSVYVMVSRKLIFTWIAVTLVQFVLVAGSYQYTNYMNGLWCGIVNTFDETYKTTPPTTPTGIVLATEFNKIDRGFHC